LCIIATGFVARNTDGVSTTLGRDGSDYSASIFGKLLSATGIMIYTDVDGVLSADPRRVKGAKVLGEVSFNEAMELAYFGAKVRLDEERRTAGAKRQQKPAYPLEGSDGWSEAKVKLSPISIQEKNLLLVASLLAKLTHPLI